MWRHLDVPMSDRLFDAPEMVNFKKSAHCIEKYWFLFLICVFDLFVTPRVLVFDFSLQIVKLIWMTACRWEFPYYSFQFFFINFLPFKNYRAPSAIFADYTFYFKIFWLFYQNCRYQWRTHHFSNYSVHVLEETVLEFSFLPR